MFEKLVNIICNYVEVEPENVTSGIKIYGRSGIYFL